MEERRDYKIVGEELIAKILNNQTLTEIKLKQKIEELIIGMDSCVESMDNLLDYLSDMFSRSKEKEAEKEREWIQRVLEAKKRGKILKKVEQDEEEEDDGGEEEEGEGEEEGEEKKKESMFKIKLKEYKGKISNFIIKWKTYISDTLEAKSYTVEIFFIALRNKTEDRLSVRLKKERIRYFVDLLKQERIVEMISDVQKTKKEYMVLIKKIKGILLNKKFVEFYDPSELAGLKFIDFYTKIEKQWKSAKSVVIVKLGEGGVEKLLDGENKLFLELFEKLDGFYNEIFDRYFLKLARGYRKKRDIARNDILEVKKIIEDNRHFLKENSKEAMDGIDKIISS